MSQENKWGWWYTDADSVNIVDSEEQAHFDAKTDIGIGPKQTYWVCKMQSPLDAAVPSPMRVGEHSLGMIKEYIADEAGTDIDIIEIGGWATVDLGNLILNFLRKHAKIKYWMVDDMSAKEYSYGGVE